MFPRDYPRDARPSFMPLRCSTGCPRSGHIGNTVVHGFPQRLEISTLEKVQLVDVVAIPALTGNLPGAILIFTLKTFNSHLHGKHIIRAR